MLLGLAKSTDVSTSHWKAHKLFGWVTINNNNDKLYILYGLLLLQRDIE